MSLCLNGAHLKINDQARKKINDNQTPDADGYKPHLRIPDEPRTEPIILEGYKFFKLNTDAENGGGIYIKEYKTNVAVKNCKFESCYGKSGGAIYVLYEGKESSYVCTISDSLFAYNDVRSQGGAIYIEIKESKIHTFTITNCTFDSNHAGQRGGAIYAIIKDGLTIERCSFTSNDALQVGYSIWMKLGSIDEYHHNEAVIRDNTFVFTPANNLMCSIYIETAALSGDTAPNANLILEGNLFDVKNPAVTNYYHLKIVAPSAFEDIKVDHCNCIKQGPETVIVPYLYNPDLFFNYDCQSIDSCQTKEPTQAPTPGQDGYIISNRIELSIAPKFMMTKTKFIKLESEKSGGAVSLEKVCCDISDCQFDSCKSKVTAQDGGGAIYLSYSARAANYTGLIFNCQFNNCESSLNGGAIDVFISQTKRHAANIQGCTFTNNKASFSGGAIYAVGRDLFSIQHCTFVDNEAQIGSSIWVQNGWYEGGKEKDNKFTLYGCSFSFRPSESNPINVYITSNSLKKNINPNSNVYIGLCSFAAENIKSDTQKNLMIFENGTFQSVVFDDCNCVQNDKNSVSVEINYSIPNFDSAFKFNCNSMDQCQDGSEQPPASDDCPNYHNRVESYGKELSVENSCFVNLRSIREGGAVYAVNCKAELEDCKFKNCSSERNGGAVYINYEAKGCELELEKCLFENCKSEAQGGALFFSNAYASKSSIEKCKFFNNIASLEGGALYYKPCGNSKLTKCLFVNNSCVNETESQGSSIYVIVQNLVNNDNVVIDGNRIRSQPEKDVQQMFIHMRKNAQVLLGSNSFSFNGANEQIENVKYINVLSEESSKLDVNGEICVDANETSGLIDGINSQVTYNCHKADPEFDSNNDDDDDSKEPHKKKNKSSLILIISIVAAAVVVIIVIVVVVVLVVLKRKNANNYVGDLADDTSVDNNSVELIK